MLTRSSLADYLAQMPRPTCICTLLFSIALVVSVASSAPPEAPADYPAKIYTRINGEEALVNAASGQRALVVAKGKRTKVDRKAGFSLARDSHYASGEITIHQIEGGTLFHQTRDLSSGVLLGGGPSYSVCRMEISADRDLSDVYCALLFDEPPQRKRLGGNSTLIFKEVGNLTAGDAKEVVVDLGILSMYDRARLVFFPIFFTAGKEVHSTLSEQVAHYGRYLEEAKHELMRQKYLQQNQGKDHAFILYLRFMPDLKPGASAPEKAQVTLKFDEMGYVEDVLVQEELDAEIELELRRCLFGWLALPPLKNGNPQKLEITVAIPLATGTRETEPANAR